MLAGWKVVKDHSTLPTAGPRVRARASKLRVEAPSLTVLAMVLAMAVEIDSIHSGVVL